MFNRSGILIIIWLSIIQQISSLAQAQPSEIKIPSSDATVNDYFGVSVSVSGDYAIVGAYGDDDNGSSSGTAYIFRRKGMSWSQQTRLIASDGVANDYFGVSVSISADYAIVGAYGDDDNGPISGSACIFYRSGTSWNQQARITANDGNTGDYFGSSVSISGDYAIVGAHGDDDNGSVSGSAYIFYQNGKGWIQQAKLTTSDGEANHHFGRSVSISGNYAIVSAPHDDDNGSLSGSAYIFYRNGTNWIQQAKLTANDGAKRDIFGNSVSISGDYVIVGAKYDDDNGSHSGSAYIFYRNQGGTDNWEQQAKLTVCDGMPGNNFGCSVSISGDYAIVGAFGDGDNGTHSGSTYIFHRKGTSWSQQAKLIVSDGAADDNFGRSVSISGDYAIAGSLYDDDNGKNSGSAYIFNRSGLKWSQQQKITAIKGSAGDRFGSIGFINYVSAMMESYYDDYTRGIYIYTLKVNGFEEAKKLTFLK